MSSKRFIPCAAVVLGLLALGAQVFGDEIELATRIPFAAIYIVIGIAIVVLRNRIASWWSSSILLPCGCAAMFLFVGVNALAKVEWQQASQIYTHSPRSSQRTTPAGFIL